MTVSTTTTTVSPAFHVRPEYGWLNDPNGPVFFGGRWHLFFQHNPEAPVHANVHWGHVSSPDLLTWRREPIALSPRTGMPDADGCWSGCVVAEDGAAWAVYSGHPSPSDPGNICIARSGGDLTSWQQPEDPVVTAPAAVAAMRDPFVFTHAGHRWAIVGAGLKDGRSAVLLYQCDDLHHWLPAGYLLTSEDSAGVGLPEAEVWECPQLAVVEGRWVLILSLQRRGAPSDVYYLVGDLVGDNGSADGLGRSGADGAFEQMSPLHFRADACGLVDIGRDFYAPALLVQDERVLMWGWSWEARTDTAVSESGWAGVLTLPRELQLTGDRLRHLPVREVRALRRGLVAQRRLSAGTLVQVSSTSEVSCAVGNDFTGTLTLLGPDDEALLTLQLADEQLHWCGALTPHTLVPAAPRPDGEVMVDFIIDRGIVEATCTGSSSLTVRSGSAAGGNWRLRADSASLGEATVTVYELGLPNPG